MALAQEPLVKRLIQLALDEDGARNDLTSLKTIDPHQKGTATIIAREPLKVCGTELIAIIFQEFGIPAAVKVLQQDGSNVAANTTIAEISATLQDILCLERTILNFLQRLSGIATTTAQVVGGRNGKLSVMDTRKTTPGLRVLEKYAVKIGGGKNHRASLSEMVLIKNNHIDADPSSTLSEKVRSVLTKVQGLKPIEIEIRNEEELEAALPFAPEIIMLDNMNDVQIKSAVDRIRKLSPKTMIEVSGGVSKERLEALSNLGIDCVSMGSLTTAARWVDISLRTK